MVYELGIQTRGVWHRHAARQFAKLEFRNNILTAGILARLFHKNLRADQLSAFLSDLLQYVAHQSKVLRAPRHGPRSLPSERRDLLIYLALARFDGRPTLGHLLLPLQRDIRALFPSYAQACKQADCLLFSVGKPKKVDAACTASFIGKKTPEALYVHASAIDQLPASLRVFEGCARAYIGRVEGANVVKLNRLEPRISYLSYPAFEDDPHPALAQSLSVHLQTFRVRTRDYSNTGNPPILHRKETFLAPEHRLRAKFARLTAAEEAKGLLDESNRIGTRNQWEQILSKKGLALRGHRLVLRR